MHHIDSLLNIYIVVKITLRSAMANINPRHLFNFVLKKSLKRVTILIDSEKCISCFLILIRKYLPNGNTNNIF